MRKDLRIGLGIGGVLLAVLVVALVVRNNSNKQLAGPDGTGTENVDGQGGSGGDPVALAGTDSPAGQPGTGSAADPGAVASTPPVDPVFGDPSTPATPAASAGGAYSSSDWDALLSGQIPPTDATARSATPTPGAAARGTGATAGLPPMAAFGPGAGRATPAGTSASPLLEGGTTRTTPGAAAVVGPTVPAGQRTHVVQQGETFVSIAREKLGNGKYYHQIARANPGVNPSALKVGTTIVLPDVSAAADARLAAARSAGGRTVASGATAGPVDRTREYRIEAGDSLYKISEKLYGHPRNVDAIYELNKQAIGPDPRKLKLGAVLRLPEPPTGATASGR